MAAIAISSVIGASGLQTHDMLVAVSFKEGQYMPQLVEVHGGKITKQFPHMGLLYALVPVQSIEQLKAEPAVDFVEQDGQFEVSSASTTTHISQAATLDQQHYSWGIGDIGAQAVQSLNDTGQGIKIAVLDTGIDYNHPDLAASYRGGYNFIGNNNNTMDDNGHGTHVAGIIAASAHAGKGLTGVAPGAQLYAVKVSDSHGSGTFDTLVEGINWAIENHMNIITMSITGTGGTQALQKAVQTAYNDGIVLVAAVGNSDEASSDSGVLYPAAYDQVIGVGSVDSNNVKSSFSLTGPKVDIVAPGSLINSTWYDGKYRLLSGTSMATPLVTGSVALLMDTDEKSWQKEGYTNGDGKWTPDEIRNVLSNTATHLGTPGKNDQYGYGLLNVTQFAQHVAKPAQTVQSTIPSSSSPPSQPSSIILPALLEASIGEISQLW
jgi:subtilisin